MSSSVTSGETSTFSQGNTSFVRHESKGKLTSFLALETWIDPASEAVWTLFVAQSSN
jgi:hypothetical protein